MSCQEFDHQLPDYLAGALSSRATVLLERHAVACARCEARLDIATRRAVEGFAPALPASLRARTLAAVALRRGGGEDTPTEAERAAPHRWARWWSGAAVVAAAAALVFVLAPRRSKQAQSLLSDSSKVAAQLAPSMAEVGTSAAALAEQRSLPEFSALDRAAAELQAALAEAPDDVELRAFLSSVTARRDELSRRVKDAAS